MFYYDIMKNIMKINPSIFKAYDVRGVYPSEINEEAAYLIAKAAVKFLKAKSLVLGRDMRPSSKPLYSAVLKALKEEGIKIFDVGLSSTPMHTFVMNLEKADSGIMITASHNPARYNGLKLEGKFGVSIGEGSGMEEIKRMVYGKTGTTNDYTDAWFIGFDDKLAVGVWVGRDDHKPIGSKETGSRAALPIWIEFMKKAPLQIPSGQNP